MPQVVKHIRSAVAGKVPTTSELALGVVAINTNDGKLFLKRSTTGSETGAGTSIVEVGAITEIDGGSSATVFTTGLFNTIDGGAA